MKKYLAELIGTMMLVVFGCGAAIVHGLPKVGEGTGFLGIAFAFGLTIVAMAYSIGNISGCHINPAVSIAMLVRGKLSLPDFGGYVAAQVVGAILGGGILYMIFGTMPELGVVDGGFGCNGFGEASAAGIGAGGAFLAEVVLTFCFVLCIVGVTSKPEYAPVAGLVIGLTLVVVHIFGIPLTGTSVNPARSIGPAIFKGGLALKQLWLFIVAPLLGGVLAAVTYGAIEEKS